MIKYFLFFLLLPGSLQAQINISGKIERKKAQFTIVSKASTTPIVYDDTDYPLIGKTVHLFAADIKNITGKDVSIYKSTDDLKDNIIIVGSIVKSGLISRLIKEKKINVDAIRNQWERFLIQTVKNPFPGVKQALVIAGSDKRGAAFGLFTLTKEMGVSPWYWWADVPVKKNEELYVENCHYISASPSVKYRGMFINDEAPALRNWAKEKFGGFNHQFYEKVYELLLRNKANYLWPAMWLPTVFATDDPENARVADEYGIVISTSHHEPMMRTHDEWGRFRGGQWNYQTNRNKLQDFWRGGVKRMGKYESVVTVGMRGDGDDAMVEGTAVDLLKTIIADQRKIIAEVTGKPAKETPQVWALYKEVQDYYEKGMRVDDDITVLLSDDNWGNIRMLPKKADRDAKRKFGMYYHLDYVGAPVSYRWQNVTQIERVWEQMKLTYEWGVKDLWLANVGDIKPMELPLSFFFDFAWDTKSVNASNLPGYYINWAKQQFGNTYTVEIAQLLAAYTKYNSRRVPEMLTPETYSLVNYREADRIVAEFDSLFYKSTAIYAKLSDEYKLAFYQLVHSPIEMCANLNAMYVAAGKNKMYGEQGRASANRYADTVIALFNKDAEFTRYYHEKFANGKWNHMMSQTHMGYTHWNHPPANKMPPVSYVQTSAAALLGYAIEHGTEPTWRGFSVEGNGLYSSSFSTFDPVNDQRYYVDIYNRGDAALGYTIVPKQNWIKLSSDKGTTQYDDRIYVSIDWAKAPKGKNSGEITISGAGNTYTVKVPVRNDLQKVTGFIENDGVVSIEASHFTKKSDSKEAHWTLVQNLGRTGSSMIIEPMDAAQQHPATGAPYLEYPFSVFDSGKLQINTHVSPTQNYKKNEGLKYAIAIDNEPPVVVNINEGEVVPDWQYAPWWTKSVADHIKIKQSVHRVSQPGLHTMKVWTLDPGVVLQKFVIDAGGQKPSYLGPPESLFIAP